MSCRSQHMKTARWILIRRTVIICEGSMLHAIVVGMKREVQVAQNEHLSNACCSSHANIAEFRFQTKVIIDHVCDNIHFFNFRYPKY